MNQAETIMVEKRREWNAAADAAKLTAEYAWKIQVELSADIAARVVLRRIEVDLSNKFDLSEDDADWKKYDEARKALVNADILIGQAHARLVSAMDHAERATRVAREARQEFFRAYTQYLEAEDLADSIDGTDEDYFPDDESED